MHKPILIIQPKDKSTKFLDRIKNYIVHNFEDSVDHFNIQYSDYSHSQCIVRIKEHKKNGLIIFLGHGRSDSLYGSKAPDYDKSLISPDAIVEFPEKYYGKEIFINSSNIDVFEGKNVFCLACNSNDKIAKEAILKGTKCFVGFGDIPSSKEELKRSGIAETKFSSSEIVKEFKTEINYIVKKSLEISIQKNYSLDQLCDIIRFITSQRIADILVNKKHLKSRKIVADYLYLFKSEMKIYGDKKQRLL